MNFLLYSLVILCLAWPALPVLGAGNARARLLLSAREALPGQTVMAGVELTMPQGWHTYWRNPGDAGEPTRVQWSLPPGIQAGKLEWPVPEKLTEAGLTTYVYYRDVVLQAPLTLATNLAPGKVVIQANVSWLECKELCVPGSAEIKADLTIGNTATAADDAGLLETWQHRLPKVEPGLAARAWWSRPPHNDSRQVSIEWATTASPRRADFFPYASQDYEVEPATRRERAGSAKVLLQKEVQKSSGNWPSRLAGLLVVAPRSNEPASGYEVQLPIGELKKEQSLWAFLGLGFLGGLILNVMPCVLPVIALKILGFVSQSRESPRRIKKFGLLYAAGVLVSFLALAALVIGVKQAGHRAGWGMQFGNPEFLVAITVLILLVALNLFGVFEVNLAGKVMGTAGQMAAREGSAGAFFNGVLATVLATPCTAPFLGAALGYAFLQSPPVIIAMFIAVGLGLAAPYVLLSWEPGWLRFLPKPGPWMERFKKAMGFPMLATAVWLFTLTPRYYGDRVWWLGLFLVAVALIAWIYGEFVQRSRRRRGLALGIVAALAIASYAFVLENELDWRSPNRSATEAGLPIAGPNDIDWRPWSQAAVANARAEGRPILVDFTADWCLTCQFNAKTSLDIPAVRSKLKSIDAVALLGDYTTVPGNITAELNRFGRAGVPLVLVYPRETNRPPEVLPEILTPETVLNALNRAAQ
ncbi:MAG: thioredoxin family protein [Candidatus Omnitrophica bacterium]|nr:thioredoxin family protein [Candidatus Omnitrophota bacterium]